MTLKKLVLITAGAMLLSGTAMAKNINVPGDFAKIADALGNADAGDTILVKRGVYNENITLIMGVVLKGEDPLTTIIDGGRRGPTVMGTSGAEMSHFTVRNGLEGILCENAAPYIHHCYVIDNHATGIGAFISLPWLRNNVVYGNRWSGILAWGAKSLDAYIEQNVVLRNGYSGLALKGPTNLVARNNNTACHAADNDNRGDGDAGDGQNRAERAFVHAAHDLDHGGGHHEDEHQRVRGRVGRFEFAFIPGVGRAVVDRQLVEHHVEVANEVIAFLAR